MIRHRLREPLPWLGGAALALLAVLVTRNLPAVAVLGYPWWVMLTGLAVLITSLWWPAIRPDHLAGAAIEATGRRGGLAAAAILVVAFGIETFSGADQPRLSATVWATTVGVLAVFTMTGWCAARELPTRSTLQAGLVAASYAALLLVIVGVATMLVAADRVATVVAPTATPAVAAAIAVRNTIDSALTHLVELPLLATVCSLLGAGVARLASRAASSGAAPDEPGPLSG